MKIMSVLLTLGLLIAADRLAAAMRRNGTLPAERNPLAMIAHTTHNAQTDTE